MTKHQYVLGKAQKLSIMYCPCCHKKIDGATPVNNKNAPGKNSNRQSLSFCLYCANILIWNRALNKWDKADPDVAKKALEKDPSIKLLHEMAVQAVLAKAIKI